MQHQVIYIMGVSGSGKSTIGEQLASRTGFGFYDADSFHSVENKKKMQASIPLSDADRYPWLDSIHAFVVEALATRSIVLVCSALKQAYRERLSKDIEHLCTWVYLEGDYGTILERMEKRQGHYMPASLLRSQFEALEVPEAALRIDIRMSPAAIVEEVLANLARNTPVP